MKRMPFPLRTFFLSHLWHLAGGRRRLFFKFPNDFSTGGVSGLSILLGRVLPMVSPSFWSLLSTSCFFSSVFSSSARILALGRYTARFSSPSPFRAWNGFSLSLPPLPTNVCWN